MRRGTFIWNNNLRKTYQNQFLVDTYLLLECIAVQFYSSVDFCYCIWIGVWGLGRIDYNSRPYKEKKLKKILLVITKLLDILIRLLSYLLLKHILEIFLGISSF